MQTEPLFLQNKDWYTTPEDEGIDSIFFEDGRGYHIKDDAPQEAKDSYDEFYQPMFYQSIDGAFEIVF